jgi:hypothetical protein
MLIAGFDLRVVPLLWAITALLLLGAALLLGPNIPWGRLRQFWQRAPRLVGGVSGLACLLAGWWLIQALQLVKLAAVLAGLLALLPALLLGIYLPGLPARAHVRRRDRLLLQTVDLTGYLQFVVESSQGDVEILRRYVRRPQRPIADVQAVGPCRARPAPAGECLRCAGGAGDGDRLVAADCELHDADARRAHQPADLGPTAGAAARTTLRHRG